ncbi:ATP-binding protein [bacterium]|nr:ATP-binding protein [bacterium]
MIKRDEYLKKLISFKDKELIKVITGIRRCGKSTLFKLFQEYLLNNGVEQEQIISINFEDLDYEYIDNYKILYDFIKSKLNKNKKNYIFLDEVQHVKDFEKAIDSLYINKNTDLYITGSNAFFLSGELATLLSGRYVEIKMLPLSFKEYSSALPDNISIDRKFSQYLEEGGFPYLLNIQNETDKIDYLKGIYNTIVLKDVVTRIKVSDVSILESIVKFMFDNVGNSTSAKKISDTLTSYGRKVTMPTVEKYLSALVDSFILQKVNRYDISGKQYLKTAEKYYVTDLGLQRFLLNKNKLNLGHNLENIVFLELVRRGYKVYVGKIGFFEVDFIAEGFGYTNYYQVALTVKDTETLARELKPLNSIKDHNPKYLITADLTPETSHNGIRQINIIDWLLNK